MAVGSLAEAKMINDNFFNALQGYAEPQGRYLYVLLLYKRGAALPVPALQGWCNRLTVSLP